MIVMYGHLAIGSTLDLGVGSYHSNIRPPQPETIPPPALMAFDEALAEGIVTLKSTNPSVDWRLAGFVCERTGFSLVDCVVRLGRMGSDAQSSRTFAMARDPGLSPEDRRRLETARDRAHASARSVETARGNAQEMVTRMLDRDGRRRR